jgi:hypothetical protein
MSKKSKTYRRRRVVAIIIIFFTIAAGIFWQASSAPDPEPTPIINQTIQKDNSDQPLATDELSKLPVKDRAPKTGYKRAEFGNGWASWGKCDTRQRILARDLTEVKLADDGCTVLSGVLDDPYTGTRIEFVRGTGTSSAVQIDHVVALSNAWQTGAQELDANRRKELANDDLELIAVEGRANMQKSDSDAADWLPPFKPFRCQFIARQIAVKVKYALWVTPAEHDAMAGVLATCPAQQLPAP